jgi:pectate lyase
MHSRILISYPGAFMRFLSTAVSILFLWSTVSAQSGDVLSPKLEGEGQRAFPTAEGFGAGAIGGRGGKVIFVENTKEGGQGSLAACITAKGPRTCVFRIGGTITLDKRSLVVEEPFLTIAGETAPGDGIAIRNGPRQKRPSIEIKSHDVIIRHLRLRPGPHAVEACCSGAIGLYTAAARDIMLDHISASWGSDETVDSEEATNFTWQWGITSEPLLDGGPGKKDRARNMLFTKGGNISVHHSLFAMGQFRNPLVKTSDPSSVTDIVNNVLYSPQWQYVIAFGNEWATIQANVIGNYKFAGKNLSSDRLVHLFEESAGGFSVFLEGNVDKTYIPSSSSKQSNALAPEQRSYVAGERFPSPSIVTHEATLAAELVLKNAGATKPARDAVDQRIINEVLSGTGRILKNDPNKVGGWPVLLQGTPYEDSDRDGMSNEWETANGLALENPADGNEDADGDGWTNFEEFLHDLAGDNDNS